LRKLPFKKDSPKVAITGFRLQETFNTIFGLKTDKSSTFAIRLFKGILSSSVKLTNRGFPGGFVHSLRAQNAVKSDSSVLALLGWTTKIPSQSRIDDVLFSEVLCDKSQKDGKEVESNFRFSKLGPKTRTMSFIEFRTAVKFSLPKIDPSKPSFDDDLKKLPLEVHPPRVISNYTDAKLMGLTNSLQQSYAFKLSIGKPNSKTNYGHYRNARNHLLHLSDKVDYRDAKGQLYKNFGDIPEHVQKYLRKKYLFPSKSKETESGEATTADPEIMEVDQQASQPTPQPKRQKKGKEVVGTSKGANTRSKKG